MTDSSLHELLLSIATGGPQCAQVHRGNGVVFGPFRSGLWERGTVEVVQRPGEHPGIWEELQTTIARLSKMGGSAGTGAHSAESPVPFHKRASDVAAQLGNEVVTLARLIAEENPELVLTATTVPEAARWIAHWLTVFPSLLDGRHDEMHAGVARWVRQAERVIFQGPDRIFAGRCETPLTDEGRAAALKDPDADVERCAADLYAHKDKGFIGCRECNAVHDVAYRKDWLSKHLASSLVTAAEAAPYLSWLTGKDIKVDTIHKWRRHRAGCEADESGASGMCGCRGRVEVRGSREGRPLYRFGELRLRADEVKTRASKGSAA